MKTTAVALAALCIGARAFAPVPSVSSVQVARTAGAFHQVEPRLAQVSSCTALHANAGEVEAEAKGALDNRIIPLWPSIVLITSALAANSPGAFSMFTGARMSQLISLSMISLGTHLTSDDFSQLRPKSIASGIALQYTVMPFMAWLTMRLFGLPRILAAGVGIVGACPGGIIANHCNYIAGSDLALSVVLTVSSLVLAAPLLPVISNLLIGEAIQVNAAQFLSSALRTVILPIGLGMAIKSSAPDVSKKIAPYTAFFNVLLVAALSGSVVAHNTAAVAAAGPALILALTFMHAGGFFLSYINSRFQKLSRQASRTIALSVGTQNSLVALPLSQAALGAANPLAVLPAAVSMVVHSVMSAGLAARWRKTPADKDI